MKELKKVLPIERAKMRLKIAFLNGEQSEKMKTHLESNYKEECEIEKVTEKMMQLKIEPSLYRELNNIIKKDKEFYSEVSIEISDQ